MKLIGNEVIKVLLARSVPRSAMSQDNNMD
jgi:hypothetical protein